MARPAKEARDKAQTIWPGANIIERGRGYIKHGHPTDPLKAMWDGQAGGAWHIRGSETEIDTAWIPSADPYWDYEMLLADYHAYAKSDFSIGQVVKYVHPGTGESIAFQPQQLQYTNDLDQIQPIEDPQVVIAALDDDKLYWAGAFGTDIDLRWEAQTARLDKTMIIQNASALPAKEPFIIAGGNPVLRFTLIMQKSSNDVEIWVNGELWDEKPANPVETSGRVEFRYEPTGETLWSFALPRSWDGTVDDFNELIGTFRLRKTGPNLFIEHRIPTIWLETAAYPVIIDTTVDEQVGASADDASEREGFAPDIDFWASYAGNWNGSDWMGAARFQTVNIAGGVTVDVAYIELDIETAAGSPTLKVCANDVDDAAAISETEDYIHNLVQTTAQIDWDDASTGWDACPEAKTVAQEIFDRGGWSANNDMLWIVKNDGGASGNYIRYYMWDWNTSLAPKLHIEYTAAPSGYTLDCAAGSYAITGTAASPLHDKKVSAGVGSYTVTGTAASLEFGYKVAAGAGAYTLSGQDTTLLKINILGADAGSYSITGAPAALKKGRTLTAESGSYAIAGAAASLLKIFKLSAEAGSYALTGQIASLLYGYTLSATAGSYAISGQTVALLKTWLLAATGSTYTFTGQDVDLTYGMAVTGIDPWELYIRSIAFELYTRSLALELRDRSVEFVLEDL